MTRRGHTFLVALASLASAAATAHPFLNSAEPQCDGGDVTVLMCDDYEDGSWFVTNADNGGPGDPRNDGWAGTIYATDPLGQNFARCGGKGAVGTNCAATTGARAAGSAGGQAWHRLGPQTATNYPEIYHREYLLFLPGYRFGHEKWTFYENGSQQHGLTQTPFGADMFDWAQQQGSGCPSGRCPQNQGNDLHMVPGRWYYMETHLDLQNGVVEFWQDDCGTDGLGCTGPGTLRLRWTGLTWSNAGAGCCNAHQENWCPTPGGAGSCTGEVYRDQTVWATRRIGPMRVTAADGGVVDAGAARDAGANDAGGDQDAGSLDGGAADAGADAGAAGAFAFTTSPPTTADCNGRWRYAPATSSAAAVRFSVRGVDGQELPASLFQHPETGALLWEPSGAGTFAFELVATTQGATAVQRIQVEVSCGPPTVSCACTSAPGVATLGLVLLAGRRRRRSRSPADASWATTGRSLPPG